MAVVVAVAGLIGTVGSVIVFVVQRKHPENLGEPSRQGEDAVSGRESLSGDVQERPAGPDAENMSADRPGGFVPPGPPPG